MKKAFQPIFVSLFVLFITAQPIHALTILINDAGQITISEGQVLGDNTEHVTTEEKSVEMIKKMERKNEEKSQQQAKTLKIIKAAEEKRLKIKSDQKNTEISIEKKESKERPKNQDQKIEQLKEKIETRNLELKLPAKLKTESTETLQTEETRLESALKSEKIQKVTEERQKRSDLMEIRTKTREDGSPETEFEAGSVKAKLRANEFSVDPKTNAVTITTPTGKTHVLQHLPDQALQQMAADGLVDPADPAGAPELEVETKNDGAVVYKTTVAKTHKLFGFIPFEDTSTVELIDGSGETTITPSNNSFLNRLLLRLSN
jgi:hypothetical protein